MYYTIDSDYAINAHETAQPKEENQITFGNLAEFQRAAGNWLMPQFVDLWNSFAGVPPFGQLRTIKKFENRNIATKRIWQALESGFAGGIQPEQPSEAPDPDATITSEEPIEMPKPKKATKPARVRAQSAPKAPKAATAPVTATRAGNGKVSQKDTVLALIGRKTGATLPELMETTGWQAHSVRGFIATLHTKHGVNIASSKNDAGERVYQGAA